MHTHTHMQNTQMNQMYVLTLSCQAINYLDHRISKSLSPKFSR